MTPRCASLNELLLWREERGPDRLAFTFLREGIGEESNWTCADLVRKACGVAAVFGSANSAGQRALLLYPPGPDFIAAFWGCLLAGVIAVPVYPPRSNHNLLRLKIIVDDAQASFVLTSQAALARMQPFIQDDVQFSRLSFIPTDGLPEAPARMHTNATPDTVAFLQYTSGSTGNPKGVVVSHSNVLENQFQIQEAFQQNEESVIAGWLPVYHDMGLLGNVIHPVYVGARGVLLPHLSFLQRPFRWLEMITRYRATASGGPNFAYDLCARRITGDEVALLDLSSWKVAFNGAEPVRDATLQRFTAKFKPAGFNASAFCPCYGLAEATLLVSGRAGNDPPAVLNLDANDLERNRVRPSPQGEAARPVVSCGQVARGSSVAIVDPLSLRESPPDEVGEVWVSGPGIAQGYWNRDEESASVFRARIPGGSSAYLRTGDLGFLRGHDLFITGRLKDLIIIRGRNHYPQDLEATVEAAHPAVRSGSGAAFSVEAENGEEQLVIVYEMERGQEKKTAGVLDSIRNALVERHEIQPYAIVLVRRGGVPRTSSGKIQRRACRDSFLSGTLPSVAEWRSALRDVNSLAVLPAERPETLAEIESWLVNRLSAATGGAPGSIDLTQSLAHYGMDSLTAITFRYDVESELGLTIPLSSLLSANSGRELARELFAARKIPPAEHEAPQGAPPFVPSVVEERESTPATPREFPLSSGQQSLWFLFQLDPHSVAYNLSYAARVPVEVNVAVLRKTLEMLVRRHPALRTTFHSSYAEAFQRVHANPGPFFQEWDASSWSESEVTARLERESSFRFDLEQAPPFRVTLLRRSQSEYVLLFVLHHVIADLWSLAVLTRELMLAYAAEINGRALLLPILDSSYADFVRWERQLLSSSTGEELFAYWKNQLAGDLPILGLPTDRPRPSIQTYRGALTPFKLDVGLGRKLEEIAGSSGCTAYMLLLAAFQLLLCRYSDQQEVLVGSPTAERSKREWAGIFGYFVNTLVMRSRLAPQMKFAELLAQVRQTVLEALDHQHYPFSALVERLHPGREPSRSPIFQAMFTFQKTFSQEEEIFAFALGEPGARLELQGFILESMSSENRGALFDVMLVMAERRGAYSGFFQYNADLFDPETIDRMVGHWRNLLAQVAANHEMAIDTVSLLGSAERRQVVTDWNATAKDYGPFVSVLELFEAQAQRTPSDVAVQFEQESLTYDELNDRANLLARYMFKYVRKLGGGVEVPVGVCMERGLDLVIALVGILKIGSAYLPLEPDYPAERLAYMVSCAQAPLTICQETTDEKLSSYSGRIFNLDNEWPLIIGGSSENSGMKVDPENMVYLIFTSGSTGRPKGVMSTHAGLRNKLLWMQENFPLGPGDRLLQKTPFGFDVSVWEFFWPLITGARLVMARPGGHQDPAYLGRAIEEFGITTVHFVPSMLRQFLESGEARRCGSLRRIFCSGEALPPDLAQECLERIPAALHNLYGPTEASIEVTHWPCAPETISKSVPIGKPIANVQTYVLDSNMKPQPVSVPGELYLGGVGLARGYVHAPDLTAERFVPNPFATAGGRLYRTGDHARYRPDGNLEFLGRRDAQIKLRGNRIELGEIESALRQSGAVNDAAVIVAQDKQDGPRLVAYVTGFSQISTAGLREALKQQLPDYMIPSDFVVLEELPLSPNGKLDRKALPMPSREGSSSYVPPRDDVERALCGIWMEVLGFERIGITDNFFDYGGHSLLATRVLSRVREILHVEVPLRRLFESPTVAGLAEAVKTALAENQAGGQLAVDLKIKKLPRKPAVISHE